MKRLYILFLFLTFQITAPAQCPQRYLDRVFSGIDFKPNINYGGNKLNLDSTRSWLDIDVYEPKGDTAQLRPLVILIHGGGFTNWPPLFRTSPDIVELATDLAKRGYVVVSPEYRLFSGDATYEKTIETVMAASVDINDAVCFLVHSIGQGNPYRIDTSRFIMGGSSAGAALSLNLLFIDDTASLSPEYRVIMDKVAAFENRDPEEIMTNKFCGVKTKGVISISGALIDTSLIKPKNASVLLIHGTADHVVPFGLGYMYSSPDLPKLYGPGSFYDILLRAGIHTEFDIYPGLWHMPILWNFSEDIPGAVKQTLLTGSIFNRPILDSTEKHMARFCYTVIGSPQSDCQLTGISNTIISNQLKISPNPSAGIFTVKIPKELSTQKFSIQVQNMIGQTVFDNHYDHAGDISIDISGQEKGMYLLKINFEENGTPKMYISKILSQ